MLRRTWFLLLVVVGVFAFVAGSAQATTYVKGYVRPSGDGTTDCSNPTMFSCVNLVQSITTGNISVTGGAIGVLQNYDVLEFSTGSGLNTVDAVPLNLLGIQPGDTITFDFTTPPNASTADGTANSTFGLLGCLNSGGALTEINGTNIGGIFDSSGIGQSSALQTTYCTNSTANLLGDGMSGASFMNGQNVTVTPVSFTFVSGPGVVIPSQLAFAFPDTNQDGSGVPLAIIISGPTGGGGGGTGVPEPASMTLLAAGLLGLAALRRNRAARV